MSADTRDGVQRIADQRARQLEKGWSPEYDDAFNTEELAYAAVVYATPPRERVGRLGWLEDWWPWRDEEPTLHNDMPTPTERRHELELAGAFAAAEIDRLTRVIENADA